jgi:ATPase subunit of ABC transporter with duplicated ATPase domains
VDRFPETEKISPPLLQLNDVTFGYSQDKVLLKKVNIDIGLDSRMAVVGANGAGAYFGRLDRVMYLTDRVQVNRH